MYRESKGFNLSDSFMPRFASLDSYAKTYRAMLIEMSLYLFRRVAFTALSFCEALIEHSVHELTIFE